MLYVHCGWPRTATTAFQGVMARHREELAAAGVLYPRRWQGERWRGDGNAHHGVVELFEAPRPDRAAIEGFQGFIDANSERTILISSEFFTEGLPGRRSGALPRLLQAAQQVTPVACLWTLRCAADLLEALHLSWLQVGEAPPTEFSLTRSHWHTVRAFSAWLRGIARMPELEEAAGGNALYGCYDERGGHHEELLRAVGVPAPLRSKLLAELRAQPKVNMRRSQKVTVALLHREAITARAGVEISVTALERAWREGDLRFPGDARCDLVDREVLHAAHEEALAISRRAGFAPYVDLFAGVEVGLSSPVSLDPDVLTDADLELLSRLAPLASSTRGRSHA